MDLLHSIHIPRIAVPPSWAAAIAGSLISGMIGISWLAERRLKPHRRFIIEMEARRYLTAYYGEDASVGDRDSDPDGVGDSDGDANGQVGPSLVTTTAGSRGQEYTRCRLQSLCSLTAAARRVGCSSEVLAGLDAAVEEQCWRRTSSEAAQQLALEERDADFTLKCVRVARTRLSPRLVSELAALRRRQAQLGRSLIFDLASRLWVTRRPHDAADNDDRQAVSPPPDRLTLFWASLFLSHVAEVVVVKALSPMLVVGSSNVGVLRLLLPQPFPFQADDMMQVVSDLITCGVPLVSRLIHLRVQHAVEMEVHRLVFARFAATDQAVLDTTFDRKVLVEKLTGESAEIQRTLTRAPEALGRITGSAIVLGISVHRREVPLWCLGLASAMLNYGRLSAFWRRFSNGGDASIEDLLQHIDSRPIPPSPELLGFELLLVAAAEEQREDPTGRSTHALAHLAARTMWSTALPDTIGPRASVAVSKLLRRHARYCARSTNPLLRSWAPQIEYVGGLRLVEYDPLHGSAATHDGGAEEQRAAILRLLDEEERSFLSGATLHRLPVLELTKWDENTFHTLRQLGMEVTMASRSFLAQQQEMDTDTRRELAAHLMGPHSSVFINLLWEWKLLGVVAAARRLVELFPALNADSDTNSDGCCGGPLDGPLRRITIYQCGCEEALTTWASFRKLASTARLVASTLEGLRVTIDIDPTLPEHERRAKQAAQLRIDARTFTRSIRFHDVHFAYPACTHRRVLRGATFTIPRGQVTGIIGPSGVGKSTLFKLLKRLYYPQPPDATAADILGMTASEADHTIYIDDEPIDRFNAAALRAKIALVPQQPLIIDGASAFHNIAMGAAVSEERVAAAAKRAQCHEFIMLKPKGYATTLFDRSLSGGEKQRIAIARALVREPEILLLDEPTSALDATNERLIFDVLASLRDAGCTIVIIAHRLATLNMASHIVMMEGGRCTGEGPPAEVYAAHCSTHPSGHSLYRRYLDQQEFSLQPADAAGADRSTAAAARDPTASDDGGGLSPDLYRDIELLRALRLGPEVDEALLDLERALASL